MFSVVGFLRREEKEIILEGNQEPGGCRTCQPRQGAEPEQRPKHSHKKEGHFHQKHFFLKKICKCKAVPPHPYTLKFPSKEI